MFMSKFIRVILALLLLTAPAWANATLIGTVTYRERVALPPDAWLRVTLVTLPAAAPVVGASAGIPARGQVPIGFALNVHSGLDPDIAYGLMAEISSQGRVMFRNYQPAPVIVGSGKPVGIIVQFAPDPPHEAPEQIPETPPELFDVVWTVTSISGRPTHGERPLTLSIAADFRAGGSGGCNNYFTEAALDGERLTFGPAAATRMACEPAIMDQETAYFAALAAVASYERDADGLRLLDAAGVPLIGLVRTP